MKCFLRRKQNPDAIEKENIQKEENEKKKKFIVKKDNLNKNILHTPDKGLISSIHQELLQTNKGQITQKNKNGQLKRKRFKWSDTRRCSTSFRI